MSGLAYTTTFSLSRELRDMHAAVDEIDGGGDCVQLDGRRFCARWTEVNLPPSTVRFGREDVATLRRIRTPLDTWLFFIPLTMPTGVRWDGCVVSTDSLVVCPPSSTSLVVHSGRVEFAIVSAAARDAADLIQVSNRELLRSSAPRLVLPPARDFRVLASELIELRAKAEFFPDTMTLTLIRRIALHLRRRLRRCLHGVKTRALERETGRSRGSIVQHAEDFFREHLGEAVSITELAAATGVSDRRLRQAFHQVCLTSPKKYLRLWQLQQVRRSLRAGTNAHAAVTTAASQYGFTEFGRFAGEYRTLFGEVPSQTLHRARRDWTVARAV